MNRKSIESVEYLLSSISELDINSEGLDSLIEQYSVDTSSSLSESSLQSVQALSSSSSGVTRERAMQWINEKLAYYSKKPQIGGGMDIDGAYGSQCVDWIMGYAQELWNINPFRRRGNAIDLWNKAPRYLPEGWQKIVNTPDFVPQPGDIHFFKMNHAYGHTGIITAANINSFDAVDQNYYPYSLTVGTTPQVRKNQSYKGFLGVIRPKFVKIVNALELPCSNAKLEATNNLIKVIKRNAFGFRKMKTL